MRVAIAPCQPNAISKCLYISHISKQAGGAQAYIEYSPSLLSARICVFLRHCDYFFG